MPREPEIDISSHRFEQASWIHPDAKIGSDVRVDPGAVIGPGVEIGDGSRVGVGAVLHGPTVLGPGTQIGPHCVFYGETRVGRENRFHASCVIGGDPQDSGYAGQVTRLEIGDRNVFREGVTISRGSTKGSGLTRIGNDNFLMAAAHVGHDSIVEDRCVFANSVLIAGHCHVQTGASIAGSSGIVQFSTVGRYAFLGGVTGARRDLEPFLFHDSIGRTGHTSPLRVNMVGLQRAGFDPATVQSLRKAYSIIFRRSDIVGLDAARKVLAESGHACAEVDELIEFMRRAEKGRFGRQLDRPRGSSRPA